MSYCTVHDWSYTLHYPESMGTCQSVGHSEIMHTTLQCTFITLAITSIINSKLVKKFLSVSVPAMPCLLTDTYTRGWPQLKHSSSSVPALPLSTFIFLPPNSFCSAQPLLNNFISGLPLTLSLNHAIIHHPKYYFHSLSLLGWSIFRTPLSNSAIHSLCCYSNTRTLICNFVTHLISSWCTKCTSHGTRVQCTYLWIYCFSCPCLKHVTVLQVGRTILFVIHVFTTMLTLFLT